MPEDKDASFWVAKNNLEPAGIVIAVRLFYDDHFTPFAELRWTNGAKEIIQWNDCKAYHNAMQYVTAYTLFYDEREKRSWEEW